MGTGYQLEKKLWVPVGTGYQREKKFWVPMGTGYRSVKNFLVPMSTKYRPENKFWVPMDTGYRPENKFWVPIGYRDNFHLCRPLTLSPNEVRSCFDGKGQITFLFRHASTLFPNPALRRYSKISLKTRLKI